MSFQDLLLGMQTQQPEFEKLIKTGESLVERCENDTEPVEETLAEAKRDWDAIKTKLNKASAVADQMGDILSKLDNETEAVDKACIEVDEGLKPSAAFGTDFDAGEKEVQRLRVCL